MSIKSKHIVVFTTFVMFVLCCFLVLKNLKVEDSKQHIVEKNDQLFTHIDIESISFNPKITDDKPPYLDYNNIVKQLSVWCDESDGLAKLDKYGQSTQGKDLYYLKISTNSSNKDSVLLTSCTHGNEPLSTATMMWYIGSILKNYNSDENIKSLLSNIDILFVPVVSPDSYPTKRYVDGVDPNRSFYTSSDKETIKPVKEIQNLFIKYKPKAVISGHTWGRVFLIPYGDNLKDSGNHDDYVRIVGKMSQMSGYKYLKASEMYKANGKLSVPPIRSYMHKNDVYKVNIPIFGTELDWYYRNGSFPIIIEYGTHQRIPTIDDIKFEFEKTFDSVLYFMKEAPLVKNITTEHSFLYEGVTTYELDE